MAERYVDESQKLLKDRLNFMSSACDDQNPLNRSKPLAPLVINKFYWRLVKGILSAYIMKFWVDLIHHMFIYIFGGQIEFPWLARKQWHIFVRVWLRTGCIEFSRKTWNVTGNVIWGAGGSSEEKNWLRKLKKCIHQVWAESPYLTDFNQTSDFADIINGAKFHVDRWRNLNF